MFFFDLYIHMLFILDEKMLCVSYKKNKTNDKSNLIWAQNEISNNVVCATSKGSDQPALFVYWWNQYKVVSIVLFLS